MKGSRYLSLLLAVVLTLPLMGCGPAKVNRYTGYFLDTFDTVVSAIIYTDGQASFDKAFRIIKDEFTRYHRLFDIYHPYEGIQNLYTINKNAASGPVRADPCILALLSQSVFWHDTVSSAVNIAMGTVLSVWKETILTGILPDEALLTEAAAHTDIRNLILDDGQATVYFADPYMQLDVGAVAKGYAAEQAALALEKAGYTSFLINAGGNIRAGGPPGDGRPDWGVGLQDPFVEGPFTDTYIATLLVNRLSVVSSGDYQRYTEIDGVRYHHIIDEDTSKPAVYYTSVTVVTKDSGFADFLSTAVFILPFDKSRELVQSLEGVEALWVFHDGQIEMTEGLAALLKDDG